MHGYTNLKRSVPYLSFAANFLSISYKVRNTVADRPKRSEILIKSVLAKPRYEIQKWENEV
jgi:hypothetical protein